jgi:hypothetical protein
LIRKKRLKEAVMRKFVFALSIAFTVYCVQELTAQSTQPQPTMACGWHGDRQAAPIQAQANAGEYGMPDHQLTVMNATQCFVRFSVGRPKAANDLAPGETASTAAPANDGKKHRFSKIGALAHYDRSSNIDVPIVALFYADAAHATYVGAAVVKITLPGYGMTSGDPMIVFRPENISFASDTDPRGEMPGTTASLNTKQLVADFDSGEGVGLFVFVWNSPEPARVMFNGVDQGQLQKGQMYYLATRHIIAVRVTTQDADGIHVKNFSYGNEDWYGVTVKALFVLSAHDLQ